ncbi:MAG: glycerol kinase [Acidobacteria bacterium 13_1_20CM_3_53_8]|nr:MAG: glycerol kinase [Acidobacteria bacterium 13_1_20CM_3_53_8]
MTTGYVLAIDQGTTGTKVIVFDHEGGIRGQAYSEFTQHYPQPGWVEHDAEEIWRVSIRLVEEALMKAKVKAGELRAIGITNQRETAVMWERSTGEAVARAIVWQDRRTASTCDELKRNNLEELFREKTGLVIDAYFSGTKIKWLLDNVKNLRERAALGEIAFGTIDSWLVWKLTGGAAHVTDYSNASRTLLYNIKTLCWDDELLQILDVPRTILPEVKPSSFIYGHTDPEIFFGASIPVAGIAGDQQAALFGQGCYHAGTAKNTYGTGSFILLNTGTQAVQSRAGLLTTIAWGIADEPVEYALEGSVFITGAGVQWLRDGLGIIKNAAETEALAQSLKSNDGVYFVPALVGLGAPHWDAYARALLIGMTRGTTRAHVARAALESMCYQTRDVVGAMERDSGIRLTELRVDGGAVNNQFLMQFQSDILGVPLAVPSITETTSLGAAYLAGLAVGFWKSREELEVKWKVSRRYEPRIVETERERLYSRWLRAVERARGWALES